MTHKRLSVSKRLINVLIDSIFVAIINGIWITIFYYNESKNILSISTFQIRLFYLTFLFLYYLICEFFWNKTIGKLITKSSVVNLKYECPSFFQIIIRTFVRFIPFEALSFINMGIGWHDKFSQTIVIKDLKK
jgi:uncharacterized RDD family membrane protein YckC